MEKSINISDFHFQPSGHGHYKVTYTSPKTLKKWTTCTSDMPLIDATKNADDPKKGALNNLKWLCKNG